MKLNMHVPDPQRHPSGKKAYFLISVLRYLCLPFRFLRNQVVSIREEWLKIIPGTRHSRNTIIFRENRTLKAVRERMRIFDELRTFDIETKSRLRTLVLRIEARLALKDAQLSAILLLVLMRVLSFGIASTLITSTYFVVVQFDLGEWTPARVFLGCVVGVNAAIIPLFVIMLPQIIMSKLFEFLHASYKTELLLSTLWMLFIIIGCISVVPQALARGGPANTSDIGFVLVVLNFLGFACTFLIALLSMFFVGYWIKFRLRFQHPDAVVVDGLLHILRLAERPSEQWANLSCKREMLSQLETAAQAVERGLPRQLRGGDLLTDAWLQGRSTQMAAALRGLKRWICSPRPDTQQQFAQRIAATLADAAAGYWDNLERVEPEQLAVYTPWQVRAASLLRTILVASVPLLILWSIQQTPLGFTGDAAEYVKVGGMVWLVLTLLIALDPLFSTKVATFKDVIQSLPIPGKGKP